VEDERGAHVYKYHVIFLAKALVKYNSKTIYYTILYYTILYYINLVLNHTPCLLPQIESLLLSVRQIE
jgi:hypothetical protein